MFAVIEDGSRQYRVQKGDTLTVDYRSTSQQGDAITFEKVLLANAGGASVIGRPTIEGASVVAEVVEPHERGPKLEIQKLRRRKTFRKHTGHRQKYTSVTIKSIDIPGLEIAEPAATRNVENETPVGDAIAEAETSQSDAEKSNAE